MVMLPGCHTCLNLRLETESWEMPHIKWYECDSPRAGSANLKSFPFRHTKCKQYRPRDSQSIAKVLDKSRHVVHYIDVVPNNGRSPK